MRSAYCRPASPVAPHCDGLRTGAPLVDAGPRHVDLVSCGPWTLAIRMVVFLLVQKIFLRFVQFLTRFDPLQTRIDFFSVLDNTGVFILR